MPTNIRYAPNPIVKETTSVGVPASPNRGDRHSEIDANNDLIMEWFWNGTDWLSRNLFLRDTLLISGQSITLTNIIVGLVSGNTDNISFSINSNYGIYVTKLYAAFNIPSGNLSSSNYWTLNLKNGASVLQGVMVQSGDDGATTGDIRKSSSVINIIFPKNGKYSFSLTSSGASPSLRSPSALIEYRLSR